MKKKFIVIDPQYLGADKEKWDEFCEWVQRRGEDDFYFTCTLNDFVIRRIFHNFGGEGFWAVAEKGTAISVESGIIAVVERPSDEKLAALKNLCVLIDDIDDAIYPDENYDEEYSDL